MKFHIIQKYEKIKTKSFNEICLFSFFPFHNLSLFPLTSLSSVSAFFHTLLFVAAFIYLHSCLLLISYQALRSRAQPSPNLATKWPAMAMSRPRQRPHPRASAKRTQSTPSSFLLSIMTNSSPPACRCIRPPLLSRTRFLTWASTITRGAVTRRGRTWSATSRASRLALSARSWSPRA